MKVVRNLFSAKQVGTLYHYTTFYNLVSMLEDDKIVAGDSRRMHHPMNRDFPSTEYRFISTTRDKNFHRVNRGWIATQCRLVLDGDKISNKYRVLPYDYFWDNTDPDEAYPPDRRWDTPEIKKNPNRLGPRPEYYESEEMILLPGKSYSSMPVFKYLIRVDVVRKYLSHLSDYVKNKMKEMLDVQGIPYKVIT